MSGEEGVVWSGSMGVVLVEGGAYVVMGVVVGSCRGVACLLRPRPRVPGNGSFLKLTKP